MALLVIAILEPLHLEKNKVARAKFKHVMQLGIIRRSEQNAWASPFIS